jgi:hypothetical protein
MGALPSLQNKYHPKDMFNADECGLFFSQLLSHHNTLSKMKAVVGGKKNKERITVLKCTNMDESEKMSLLVTVQSREVSQSHCHVRTEKKNTVHA